MRVGLLICDEPAERYLKEVGDYLTMFSAAFPGQEFVKYEIFKDQFPSDVRDETAYMMTGSRYSVYDNIPWIGKGKALIRDIYQHNLKFVGVCFGHQMMAEALGGKVEKARQGWNVGVKTFEIVQTKPWISPVHGRFSIQMMCQDQVVMLPSIAENLAGSSECPYGLMAVGSQMLSVQGHPEFPEEYSMELIRLRRGKIGEKEAENAVATFDQKCDLELIRTYVMNFLTDKKT